MLNNPELNKLAKQYDHSDMAEILQQFPSQIDNAFKVTIAGVPGGSFEKVIAGGMGGSALPVDVMEDSFRDKLRVPVDTVRHYDLPVKPSEKTLYIFISFSGNTEETVSLLRQVSGFSKDIVVISGGGELSRMAEEKGICLVHIPKELHPDTFQPRSATGYIVTLLARVLAEAGVLDDSLAGLKALPDYLRNTDVTGDAETTAKWLSDRIPVVYTDEMHCLSLARVAKIKFNENSKRPAFFNVFPELNHNEMIGFSRAMANFGILYLHDPDSNPGILKRYEAMKNVFSENGYANVSFYRWDIPGESKLEKIFAALMFLDWSSYILALLSEVDPTPVGLVEEFKQRMERV
ncbi:MAG: hypothetical protein JW712_10890 [Dehalococcoidales bacterium]|nr:hypothetical protein [Dehalococcoidales bacterium]